MFLGPRRDKHTDSMAVNTLGMRNEMFLWSDNSGQQVCLQGGTKGRENGEGRSDRLLNQ